MSNQDLSSIREGSSFFPLKLMDMLQNDKISDIISWMPDGNAFAIHDKKRFASEVLPLYFRGSIQFSSFTRRMNRWKFTLTRESTKSRSVYHHPLFKRNEMQICSDMQPKPQIKKTPKKTLENNGGGRHCDDQRQSFTPYGHHDKQLWAPPAPWTSSGDGLQLSGKVNDGVPYRQSNRDASANTTYVEVPYGQALSPTFCNHYHHYHLNHFWPPSRQSGDPQRECMNEIQGMVSSRPERMHQMHCPPSSFHPCHRPSSVSKAVEQQHPHQSYPSYQRPYNNSPSVVQYRGYYEQASPLRPAQQEMHRQNLQTDASYQELYNSSLRDIHAIHQAQLAVQVELSHLAMMSSIVKPHGQKKEGA